MLSAIVGIIGIISTIIAWKFNPRRIIYTELDKIATDLDRLNVIRDKALEMNNSDSLTVVTVQINQLQQRRRDLMNRIKTLSLIIVSMLFIGCSHNPKPVFFNDSDKVYAGNKNESPATPTYDWVLMSKGTFRNITSQVPESGKAFKIVYGE